MRNVSRMFGLKWTIRGAEHIRKDQAAIIVSNHQSMIDILGRFTFTIKLLPDAQNEMILLTF